MSHRPTCNSQNYKSSRSNIEENYHDLELDKKFLEYKITNYKKRKMIN